MRKSLYPVPNDSTLGVDEVTRKCEGLFKENMNFIDDFLKDTYGRTNLREIDCRKAHS